MNFSFVIITSGDQDERLNVIVDSIESQNIQGRGNYEIIIIGNSSIQRKNTKVIKFDESERSGWITRKKNLGTNFSQYENVVYMHDYISLSDGWYDGFIKFGDDFKVCMTRMEKIDGSRFADWQLCACFPVPEKSMYLLPYELTHLSKVMYISGGYWVAKRDVMKSFPLIEDLLHGESEDVEWSYRFRKDNEFSLNAHSCVRLLKSKRSRIYPTERFISYLRSLTSDQIDELALVCERELLKKPKMVRINNVK